MNSRAYLSALRSGFSRALASSSGHIRSDSVGSGGSLSCLPFWLASNMASSSMGSSRSASGRVTGASTCCWTRDRSSRSPISLSSLAISLSIRASSELSPCLRRIKACAS
ncbi:hypothetical protein D3C79_1014690 [compost metagenome]